MFTKKIIFVHKICNNSPGAIKTYAARYLEFLKSKIIGDWQSLAICYFNFKAYF